ncbi:MAG: xanthine dehydrogenase family protein molybdopterin-binding subunit [Gammaproteobacteria bacterium]|nr:xanthine dehydrogenase family protein molybdopterin-binding subunit [Gammaproteobacteria bacterium]MDH4255012.1 xanthine dehydrogenase family protein molybdopterin-binding subunit [Gammaproteobacteria bacterium]MDH5310775.1 xanthine dehydrogenase family protein molybdopterin-binding subunit [Gammaproteobacteria bacterium]
MSDYKHIGKDFTPPDLVGKVTGQAKYAEDFRADGMVFARLYTSPMAHGRVVNIDTSALDGMEGVVGILTADDVPPVEAPNAPILTNTPTYIGDPILAVAAVDELTAEEAIARIRVDIEPLPFAVDPLDSLVEGGPDAREEGNVFARSREGSGFRTIKWTRAQVDEFRAGKEPTGEWAAEWTYGDLAKGFEDAELVIEEPFVTVGYAHMSMEPRTAMAYWQNGTCYVYGSAQSQSFWMPGLARLLGVEVKDVVLISENTGGGFGSKIGAYPMAALPGWFSKKLGGRPVQLRITRAQEYYVGSARVGFQGWLKLGFAKNGRMTAADVFIVEDIGPNATGGDASSAGGAISLVYDPEAMRFRGVPVLTNTTPRGAQRGPGQNQIAAIMAPLMDKAAKALNIDRVEIRRINAVNSQTTVEEDQGPVTSAYMKEALDKGADMFGWEAKKNQPKRSGTRVRGYGIGQGYHSAGTNGFDGLVRITPDGKIHLHTGVGNLGTYSYASTMRAAAEVLKCEWDDCVIHRGSTEANLPWASYQAGSVSIFTQTRTSYVAAMDAVAKMKAIAAETLGGSADDYEIDGQRVFRVDNPAQGMSYGAIAARAIQLGGAYSGQTYPDDIHEITQRSVQNVAGSGLVGVAKDNLPREGVVPGLAAAFVEIELDLETGKYDILDYVGIADCGTVVHPQGLAQQMKGGAVWGIGMAALERHVYDPQNGLPANIGYHQCGIPTYLDVPSVTRTAAVDLPDPQNPFGARGIGEPAMGCSVAALTSAISDALDGYSFGRTPISRDMIVNYVAGNSQSFKPLQTNNF